MIGHNFMPEDLPLRFLFHRLRKDFDNVSAILVTAMNALDESAIVVRTLDQMLVATVATLPQSSVLVMGDSNGNNGIFGYDPLSSKVHNGYDCIVDASGRRWLRKQGIV